MLSGNLKLSIIIPAKTRDSYELMILLGCLQKQDFPKSEVEILIITEGTSESAKAIGIRRARGEVIGIMASDNSTNNAAFLTVMYNETIQNGAAFPMFYDCKKEMPPMDRYFAQIGGNDVLCYYMGKNDKFGYLTRDVKRPIKGTALGDNGFFVMKELIEKTDLDHYYHVDNANEIDCIPMPVATGIFHNTGETFFKFFAKRYRYGLQHAFNKNRRWHLVEKTPRDILRLLWFVIISLTFVEPLMLAFRGWLRTNDPAWFLHPLVSFFTTIVYGALLVHVSIRHLYRSLFARTTVSIA